MSDDKIKLIRDSAAEFLIFTARAGEDSIEVRYEDETVWMTQKTMGTLFAVTAPTINEHLKNIFETGELFREATIRKFRITAARSYAESCRPGLRYVRLMGDKICLHIGWMARFWEYRASRPDKHFGKMAKTGV